MRIFNLNNEYNIVCNFQNTRSGFKHVASLHKNGFSIYETKINYYNRTWERFEYESILIETINENFKGIEKDKFLEVIKGIR